VTYIVLEGTDGQGKTTLINNLKRLKPDWKYVHEPWSSIYIDKITKANYEDVSYLFARDRELLIRTEVIDAIRMGKVVISDRSVFSSYAYQTVYQMDKEYLFNTIHECENKIICNNENRMIEIIKDIVGIQPRSIPEPHIIYLCGNVEQALKRSSDNEIISLQRIKKIEYVYNYILFNDLPFLFPKIKHLTTISDPENYSAQDLIASIYAKNTDIK